MFVGSVLGHIILVWYLLWYCENVFSSQTILISESEERFQTAETDSRLFAGTEKDFVLVSAVEQELRHCSFSKSQRP